MAPQHVRRATAPPGTWRRSRYLSSGLLALALLAATPSPAAAQWVEFMEWLERLSGPRLRGIWFEVPIYCRDQAGNDHPFDCPLAVPLSPDTQKAFDGGRSGFDGHDRKYLVGLRVGQFYSAATGIYAGDNNLVYPPGTADEDKKITMFSIGPTFTWQVSRALDLVWAVELNRFGGELVDDFTVVSVDPIGAVWKPLRHFKPNSRKAGALRIPLRVKKFLDAMRGEQFGAQPGFVANAESVLGIGVQLDVLLLIGR